MSTQSNPVVLFSMITIVQGSPLPDKIILPKPLTPEEQHIQEIFKDAQKDPKGTEDEVRLAELATLLRKAPTKKPKP